MHIHSEYDMESTDYNSILYLNDDFQGGEFFTENLVVKPKPGRLTFFDGRNNYHGLREVKMHHRYSIMFWWTNTIFK